MYSFSSPSRSSFELVGEHDKRKAGILPCRPEVNARAAPSAEGSRLCESQSQSRYQEGDHGNLVGAIIVLGSKSPSYIFPACSTSREARQNGSFADLSFSGIRATASSHGFQSASSDPSAYGENLIYECSGPAWQGEQIPAHQAPGHFPEDEPTAPREGELLQNMPSGPLFDGPEEDSDVFGCASHFRRVPRFGDQQFVSLFSLSLSV